jgi:hypothetical protein
MEAKIAKLFNEADLVDKELEIIGDQIYESANSIADLIYENLGESKKDENQEKMLNIIFDLLMERVKNMVLEM